MSKHRVRRISISREPNDPIAAARVSLGRPKASEDFYIVFRGEPEEVIKLLKEALTVAEHTLPRGHYVDKR